MLKDVHLNVGWRCILSHSAFFYVQRKKKKRAREEKRAEENQDVPRGLLLGKNFYISAKSHEDVHGYARPKLPRRTMLNPPRAHRRVQLFQQSEVN